MDSVFRDAEIQSKIEAARLIKFDVYNLEETEIVSQLIFRGSGHFESWFDHENLVYSSFYEFPRGPQKSQIPEEERI